MGASPAADGEDARSRSHLPIARAIHAIHRSIDDRAGRRAPRPPAMRPAGRRVRAGVDGTRYGLALR